MPSRSKGRDPTKSDPFQACIPGVQCLDLADRADEITYQHLVTRAER